MIGEAILNFCMFLNNIPDTFIGKICYLLAPVFELFGLFFAMITIFMIINGEFYVYLTGIISITLFFVSFILSKIEKYLR